MGTYLRRTVPFIQVGPNSGPCFVLDEVRLAEHAVPSEALMRRVERSLNLCALGDSFDANSAEILVQEQYDVCMNQIYGHPVWDELRQRNATLPLFSYLLETRHYLHAATWRMSPGPAGAYRSPELANLLADHVVEEEDHAHYFESALETIGFSRGWAQVARPAPVTIEWIHLMRALSGTDPLTASLTSGLMEYSANDRSVVVAWHERLYQERLLSRAAVDALLGHVQEDLELGHGNNWREAIHLAAPLTPKHLAACLNAVCAATEMIVRWLDAIQAGTSGLVVDLAPNLNLRMGTSAAPKLDRVFDGSPVWPAEVMDVVTHGTREKGAQAVVGVGYHLSTLLRPDEGRLCELALSLRDDVAVDTAPGDADDMERLVRSWMRAIDGHVIWQTMTTTPTFALLQGWLLENYFYIGDAKSRGAAVVAACPDDAIRGFFFEHFREELNHEELLAKGLEAPPSNLDVKLLRPLPTTIAFNAVLRDLAATDWSAYAISLLFLQRTLAPGGKKHAEFYSSVLTRCQQATALVESMKSHDSIDGDLGHDDSVSRLIRGVQERWGLAPTSLRRASLVPQMCWSFLDGVHSHYVNGSAAISQRVGWHG